MRNSVLHLSVMVIVLTLVAVSGCANAHKSTDASAKRPKAHDLEHGPLHAAIAKAEKETGQPAIHSPTGVAYIDLVVGEGLTPTSTDQIVAHYIGWLPDGTQFESSHDRGRPGRFGVGDVVPGCTEGLLTMRVGGKRRVYVPGDLAYGAAGRPGLIPPDSPLIYEFELIAIE